MILLPPPPLSYYRSTTRPSGFPARARRDGFTLVPRRKATRAARAGEGRSVTSSRRLGRTDGAPSPMGLFCERPRPGRGAVGQSTEHVGRGGAGRSGDGERAASAVRRRAAPRGRLSDTDTDAEEEELGSRRRACLVSDWRRASG